MNAEAAKESKQIERALKTGKLGGKKIRCDSAEYDQEHCGGEVYLDPWYDIFSDDPKGISGRGGSMGAVNCGELGQTSPWTCVSATVPSWGHPRETLLGASHG
jgi:hypothetical protein